jgi:hypothetical protein
MKKLKFENKLSLKRETIVRLNNGQMSQLAGGGTILTTWLNCGPVIQVVQVVLLVIQVV